MLFRYPAYGKLWLGNVVSSFGDQAGWIALVWLLLRLTHSAQSVGWVTALYVLPGVVTSPIAGVWLDRFPRTRVMAVGNLMLAVIFAAVVLAASSLGRGSVSVIYVLLGLAGLLLPLNTAGGGVVLTELVPEEVLSQANFLMQTEWQLGLVLGPAAGGVLVGMIGPEAVIGLDAVTFLIVALVLATLPARRREPSEQRSSASVWLDFRTGMRFMWGHRPLLALTVMTVLFNFLYGPYEVILPVFAQTRWGGAAAFGMLWTVFAVGSLIGSIAFSLRPWRFPYALSLAAIIVLWGLVTVALALVHHLPAALAWMFVAGLVFSPWGALVTTVRQHIAPNDMLGRVSGVSTALTMAGMPIGAWIAGFVTGMVPPQQILLCSGLATIGVGVGALCWPAFRRIEA